MTDDFEVFRQFSIALNIGVVIIDTEGRELFSSKKFNELEQELRLLTSLFGSSERLKLSLLYGGYQAHRFAGKYVFFCPRGFCYIASPLVDCNMHFSAGVIAGPILMTGHDDYLEIDIMPNFELTIDEMEEIKEAIKAVPSIKTERISAMSELLFSCMAVSSSDKFTLYQKAQESQQLQSHISEYIKQIKLEAKNNYYPFEKENQLLEAMEVGDIFTAKSLLNEILGHVLLQSGVNTEIMRSRVVELISLLSRSAVKGGARVEDVFGINYECLKELDTLTTFEEIIYLVNDIVNRFNQHVFEFASAKHSTVIFKVIENIKENYMTKLSLESVAKSVYLSPAYLSKIFKDETGVNFNTYINNIRIDASKHLLRNPNCNLTDVSAVVGFTDQSYFTKVFKKREGISPGKYKLSVLNKK